MSDKEHCSKCRFFDKNRYKTNGDCKRYPPTVLALTDIMTEFKQSYPQMMPNEWCGEFRFNDKFIDLVAKYEPDTNVIATDFAVRPGSFDPKN